MNLSRSTLASLLLVGILVSSLATPPGEARLAESSEADSAQERPGDGSSDAREGRAVKAPADSHDVKEALPAELEKLVEDKSWGKALTLVRNELLRAEEGREGALRLLEARLLVRAGEFDAYSLVYRRLLEDPSLREVARDELHELYVTRGLFERAARLREELAERELASEPELAKMSAFSASIEGRQSECVRILDTPGLREDPKALLLRANALLALDDPEKAEGLYLQVLRESQDRKLMQLSHFGLGQVARIRGARAVRALQDERASVFGNAPWAELDWGLSLRALGRREEARERLEAVAKASAAIAPTARLALARLDEEEGRTEDALEHLVGALEGGVGDFLAFTRLGDLLVQEGSDDAGIEAYRLALDLFADFPPGRERLTRALAARGRWDEAPPAEEKARVWDLPSWTWDRLLDGDLPFQQITGDRDSTLANDPRRVVVALVHLRAGAPASALGWTDDVEEGEDPLLDRVRAEALELVGRREEACKLWESLAKRDLAPSRERLALAVFSEEPERALSLWREIFQRHPQNARAYVRMGRVLERAGSLAEAREAYAKSLESGWLSPEERRRVRVAIEDAEDLMREKEEEGSKEDESKENESNEESRSKDSTTSRAVFASERTPLRP